MNSEMAAGNDHHLCLRCNTLFNGLTAYVEHVQNGCSETDQQLEGMVEDSNFEEGNYKLIHEEQLFQRQTRGNKQNTSPDSRGRKRKAAVSQSSPKKRPQVSSSKRRASITSTTPERDENQSEKSGAESPGSPRRSSRRGIRISYTDLLSGVDKSPAIKSGKGDASSPAKQVKSTPCTKKSAEHKPKLTREIRSTVSVKQEKSNAKKNVTKQTKKQKNVTRKSAETNGQRTRREKIKNSVAPTKSSANAVSKRVEKKFVEKRVKEENTKESPDLDSKEPISYSGVVDDSVLEEKDVIYIKEGKFYCHVCRVYCLSKKKIDGHCATFKHARRMRAAKGSNVDETNRGNEDGSSDNDEEDEKELFECSDCEYITKNPGQYKRHLRSISHAQRTNVTLYACQNCHRKYKTEDELEDHQVFHRTPRCVTCKGTFETVELLEEHLDEENHRVVHRCPHCDKTFLSKGSMKTHMRGHDPDKVYRCDLCPYTAVQLGDMKKHMYRHQGFKPFKCSLCEYEGLTKNAVDRHMKVHMARTKDLKCDECDSCFYDTTLLKQHKYMRHNPERRYPCNFEGCTFAFKYHSSLVTHMRMHTKEKPFLCANCGYATATKYSLTKHMLLHTGEKPFHCDFPNCNYRSRLSTHLARHKIIHTGAKPFKCQLCNYACNNKQNLRKHMLSTKAHAGAKMYKCKKCDSYSSNSFRDYVMHMRKEHANDDEYISYFDVAEELNTSDVKLPHQTIEKFVATEEDDDIDSEMHTFSVVTVIPGRDGTQELKNITILNDGSDVQQKLEQVILALGDNVGVADVTEGDTDTSVQLENTVQVDSMGNLVSLATKEVNLGEHGETLVIVPEVQAETEICTSSEVAGTADAAPGEGGDPVQEFVVEIDQSGRLVTEEDMAAATWLHSMGNVQEVAEAILRGEPSAEGEQEVSDGQEMQE